MIPTIEEFIANELCDHEDESGKYYRGDTVAFIMTKYAASLNRQGWDDEDMLSIMAYYETHVKGATLVGILNNFKRCREKFGKAKIYDIAATKRL